MTGQEQSCLSTIVEIEQPSVNPQEVPVNFNPFTGTAQAESTGGNQVNSPPLWGATPSQWDIQSQGGAETQSQRGENPSQGGGANPSQGGAANPSQGGAGGDLSPPFKALPMMTSYAQLLRQRVDTFMTMMSVETRKKRKSAILCEYSLPSGSENIYDMYYAGSREDGTLIEPTQANGGFPIVLLVMGPKRSRAQTTRITALSLCNELMQDSGLTLSSSKGRIYVNW